MQVKAQVRSLLKNCPFLYFKTLPSCHPAFLALLSKGLFDFIQVVGNLSLQIQTVCPQIKHFILMSAFKFKQLEGDRSSEQQNM